MKVSRRSVLVGGAAIGATAMTTAAIASAAGQTIIKAEGALRPLAESVAQHCAFANGVYAVYFDYFGDIGVAIRVGDWRGAVRFTTWPRQIEDIPADQIADALIEQHQRMLAGERVGRWGDDMLEGHELPLSLKDKAA